MADNVSVQFGASTRNFEQGINNLQRPVADFSSRIRELNDQLSALDNPIKRVSNTANIAADSTKKLSFATAGATREFIVIGHEVLTGNFSRIPGSLLVLAERAGNLHSIMSLITPATIAWTAAIGGLVFATYEWIAVDEHLAEVQNTVRGALELNNQGLSYNQEALDQTITRMRLFSGVSKDTAEQIITSFARAGNLSVELKNKLVLMVSDYAAATGKDAPRAAADLIKMFSDPQRGAKELAATFTGILTPAQFEQIEMFAKNGDAMAMQGVLYDALGARIDDFRKDHLSKLQKDLETVRSQFIMFANADQLKPGQHWTDKGTGPFMSDQSPASAEQEHQNQLNLAIRTGYDIETKSGLLIARKNELLARQKSLINAANAAAEQGNAELASRFRKDAAEMQDQIDNAKGKGQRQVEAKAKQALEERLAVERNAVSTQVQLGKIALESKRANLDEEVALGRITNKEKIALLKEYEQEEYSLSHAALVRESQQDGLSLLQKQQIYSRLRVLYAQHQAQMSRLEAQGAREQARVYDQVFQSMNRAFKGSIDGILRGTQTWQQASANIFVNVLASWAGMLEEMAAKWLETQLLNAVVGKTEATTTIAAHASEAGAAAYASTAAIPIVGPELAPAAAQLAYGSTLAYAGGLAVGAWEIPGTMLATLHEGETVVPKNFAQGLRENGSLAGGGDIHFHVNAVDAHSIDRLFKNSGRALAASLKHQVRNLNADINALRPS